MSQLWKVQFLTLSIYLASTTNPTLAATSADPLPPTGTPWYATLQCHLCIATGGIQLWLEPDPPPPPQSDFAPTPGRQPQPGLLPPPKGSHHGGMKARPTLQHTCNSHGWDLKLAVPGASHIHQHACSSHGLAIAGGHMQPTGDTPGVLGSDNQRDYACGSQRPTAT